MSNVRSHGEAAGNGPKESAWSPPRKSLPPNATGNEMAKAVEPMNRPVGIPLLHSALLVVGVLCCAPAAAQTSASTPTRLDVNLTPQNSALVDLGYGKKLRLPLVLLPPGTSSKSAVASRLPVISMRFTFPDMNITDEVPGANIVWETLKHTHVLKKDRFPVSVFRMYYFPPDGQFTTEQPQLDPTPLEVERNVNCCEAGPDGHPIRMLKTRIRTGYDGIDAEMVTSWLAKHPEYPKEFGPWRIFVASPGSAFELWMECDLPGGARCMAHVLSKKHHMAYRVTFPPEAVAHTSEIVRAIDKLLDQWSVN